MRFLKLLPLAIVALLAPPAVAQDVQFKDLTVEQASVAQVGMPRPGSLRMSLAANGNDGYNRSLSERRAEAVKTFLTEQFRLSPEQLLAIGFGRTQLKNTANPLAAENRRVQIVNIEQQPTVSQK
jgi:hypothetical protein